MVYFSCWAFAVINILFLAPAFFFANSNEGLVLVGAVPSFVWGIIFLGMGFSMIGALLVNQFHIYKTSCSTYLPFSPAPL